MDYMENMLLSKGNMDPAEDPSKCPVVRSCYWKDSWQRMDSMRMAEQLCDVTLVTDCKTTFRAHSLVLAAGSDLFYHHFVQQQNSPHVILISDISAEALKVTLDFIYGITPTEQCGFTLLFQGAQKIGIEGAIRFCEVKLREMSGMREMPAKVCPLKDTDLMKRMLSKRAPESSPVIQSPAIVPKMPFSVHEKAFITDLTAKFIDEVLSRHLSNHSVKSVSPPSVPEANPASVASSSGSSSFVWMPETSSVNDSWGGSDALVQAESVPPLCNRVSSESSESFALTSDMNSDPGGMPMDIHHSLIPEMTLNDLTRAPECPHLKKLAANSGLVVSDEMMEGGQLEVMRETDIYREMLPKKRKLNASDLDHSLNDEPASIPSPVQESCNNTEQSDVGCWPELPDQSAVCHAEDLSIPPCIIHIAPIDDSNGQTNRVEQVTKQSPNISKAKGSHHKCEDCPETFANHASLKIHSLRCHSKGSLFTCTDCDFKSPRKKDVQAHLLAKHKKAPPGVRIFKCKQCEYMCMDKNRFNEHMNCHSKDNRHKCSKCDKAYSTRRGLQTHLQYHSQERPHKCADCDASFKVRDKLRDHIRLMHTHKGQKPFKCSYCNHASALRGNCNQHIRKTHPGMPISVTDTRVKDKSKSENAYSSLLTLPPAQESASSDSAA